MGRTFSNIHKSTLNLESKLAQDERVLIVDENDEPVRAASRLEMVIYLNLPVFRDSKTCGIEAHRFS